MTRRSLASALALVFGLGLSASAATKILNSWADPNAGKLKFKKVLAIVVTKDGSLRRTAEDELCRNMPKTPCVRGYEVLPGDEALDKAKASAKIKDGGFDGVVVMRALPGQEAVSHEAGAAQPTYYWTFWTYYDYWGTSWGVPYIAANTSYTKTQTYVRLDTNLYDMSTEKLVWSGSTQTKNPDSAREVVRDVAKTVGKDLKRKGLLD